MRRVSATIELRGSVYEAETCWYDTGRWPEWVDQLARVVEVEGDWPSRGSVVVWESGPAGRGRVTERVSEYEPRSGQASEIEDDSISGRQSVAFVPSDRGVEVVLSLDYRLKQRSPASPLIDFLFIRPAMTRSLARTLSRFEAELAARASD
jgi:Polyketide cyclase / dehydrase and lipid transport